MALKSENKGPAMTEEKFWTIIEITRNGGGGDRERQSLALREELRKLDPEQIVEFDEWFMRLVRAGYRTDLWYAATIIAGGTCHDDGFFDFRKWLVSQGRSVYAAAMKDPESLVDVVERDDPHRIWLQFELPTIAVWGEKLGKNEDDTYRDFPGTLGSNLGEVPEGDQYDDEHQIAAKFQKLWQKFMRPV